MALPDRVSIHRSRAGRRGHLGAEGSRVWGWGRGIEVGTALPCPAPSKAAARAKGELMGPHVIGNWVPPRDYKR